MDADEINDFKEFLANTKKVNGLTQYRYGRWIKDLDTSKPLTQEYLNEYVQSKGNHSQVRGSILAFLEWTRLNKVFDMPPRATGRQKKRKIRDVGKDEISIVRDYLYAKSFKNGLIFDLTYQGALRRFEVPTIQVNSFHWIDWLDNPDKPCRLTIKGKGDKERVVLINPDTAEKIFEFYRKKYNIETIEQILSFANSPTLLFTNSKGGILSDYVVYKVIRKASLKSLGRQIRTHELRHGRATELEKLGVPIKDIKNYLGHSSLATTEIYLHTSEKESLDNIENILSEKI